MRQRGQRPKDEWRGRRMRLVATMAVAVLMSAAPALAAQNPYPAGNNPPPPGQTPSQGQAPSQVEGQTFFRGGPGDAVHVASTGSARTTSSGAAGSGFIAFTGFGFLVLLATALAALAIGLVLWRAARQRPAPSTDR